MHYNTIHDNALHYNTIQYNTIHYITLHYITLHHITSHYITLPESPILPLPTPRIPAKHVMLTTHLVVHELVRVPAKCALLCVPAGLGSRGGRQFKKRFVHYILAFLKLKFSFFPSLLTRKLGSKICFVFFLSFSWRGLNCFD